jgi:hypothetical protein
MGNRYNIPVPLNVSDGGTQKARPANFCMCWSKAVGSPGRKIRRGNPESRKDVNPTGDTDWSMLCCQEKLLNVDRWVTVPQTDTGGRVAYTKARERNLVKELGKLAP